MFKPSMPAAEPPRIMLNGLSGSGRTTTALRIAQGLAPAGRIGLIDTQRGHSRAYAKEFAFEVMEFNDGFNPVQLARAIGAAASREFDVLIVDNGSPFWSGKGGFKDQVDAYRKDGRNGWVEIRPLETGVVDALATFDRPLIFNLNVREEWRTVPDPETGIPTRVRVGLEPDFMTRAVDTMWHLVGYLRDATMQVTKSRYAEIPHGELITEPGEDIGKIIAEAFNSAMPLPSWRQFFQTASDPNATYGEVTRIHAEVAARGLEGAMFLDGDIAISFGKWLTRRAQELVTAKQRQPSPQPQQQG
jgi:hypothetical protein